MADEVYRLDALRDRVVACLRGAPGAMTAGAVAVALQVPPWAAHAGLEAAMLAQLVTFAAGQGYWIAPGVAGAYLAVMQGDGEVPFLADTNRAAVPRVAGPSANQPFGASVVHRLKG